MATTRKAPKPSSANAAEASKLLLWLRANRFAVVGITVGDVSITCADVAPLPAPKTGRGQKAEPANVYEEFGGKAWTEATTKTEAPMPPGDDGDDEDDDDPT